MNQYFRAIGFSGIKNRKDVQKLVMDVITSASEREVTALDEDMTIVSFCKDFAEDVGIAVCGEFDEENHFIYDYYFPYLRGTGISSYEDITIERHIARESYAGVCDDMKVGISIIFYLQNMIAYLKQRNANQLPVRGTTLTLAGLAKQGSILMPVLKNEKQLQRSKKDSLTRSQLMEAARRGDEDARESLTLEDMDLYSNISKRIQKEDVYSLVDTYFMPYGAECDQYSVLGEITEFRQTVNSVTGEELCIMTVNCNDIPFDICINQMDLYGEPQVGRRFKGIIWLQGYVNFPE